MSTSNLHIKQVRSVKAARRSPMRPSPSPAQVLDAMRAYRDQHGKLPVLLGWLPGGVSTHFAVSHFGSWSAALQAAFGHDVPVGRVRQGNRYSDAELAGFVLRFARDTGGPLTPVVWDGWADRSVDRPRYATIARRMGLDSAAGLAGVSRGARVAQLRANVVLRAQTAAMLRRAAQLLGRPPRRRDFDPDWVAGCGRPGYQQAFAQEGWATVAVLLAARRNWPQALAGAGLQAPTPGERIVAMLIEWRVRFGFWPGRIDVSPDRLRSQCVAPGERLERYRNWGGPDAPTIARHFGSMSAAVAAARRARPDLSDGQRPARRPLLTATQKRLLRDIQQAGALPARALTASQRPAAARLVTRGLLAAGDGEVLTLTEAGVAAAAGLSR